MYQPRNTCRYGNAPKEQGKAVKSGYWHLFRYNPESIQKGINPFTLDSKKPVSSYEEFLSGEVRYDVLKRMHPEKADILFKRAADNAKVRYDYLERLVTLYDTQSEVLTNESN